MTNPKIPPLEPVSTLIASLESHKAVAAIGGSGLLASLGLVDTVRDWDVTSDAPTSVVVEALKAEGLTARFETDRGGIYATRERLVVEAGGHGIDLLLGFAARTADGVVRFPTRVVGRWLGLPIADPVVWRDAYRAIGREERAILLDVWLARGSD